MTREAVETIWNVGFVVAIHVAAAVAAWRQR